MINVGSELNLNNSAARVLNHRQLGGMVALFAGRDFAPLLRINRGTYLNLCSVVAKNKTLFDYLNSPLQDRPLRSGWRLGKPGAVTLKHEEKPLPCWDLHPLNGRIFVRSTDKILCVSAALDRFTARPAENISAMTIQYPYLFCSAGNSISVLRMTPLGVESFPEVTTGAMKAPVTSLTSLRIPTRANVLDVVLVAGHEDGTVVRRDFDSSTQRFTTVIPMVRQHKALVRNQGDLRGTSLCVYKGQVFSAGGASNRHVIGHNLDGTATNHSVSSRNSTSSTNKTRITALTCSHDRLFIGFEEWVHVYSLKNDNSLRDNITYLFRFRATNGDINAISVCNTNDICVGESGNIRVWDLTRQNLANSTDPDNNCTHKRSFGKPISQKDGTSTHEPLSALVLVNNILYSAHGTSGRLRAWPLTWEEPLIG